MKFSSRHAAPLLGVLAALAAAGTAQVAQAKASPASTTITVAVDTGLTPAATRQIQEQIRAFEKLNPGIHVVAKPYDWVATTFTAQLAGGTLPDVFTVPFTNGRQLIDQKQVANIEALIDGLPYVSELNPALIPDVTGTDGQIDGLPIGAYGQALYYNRQLFSEAGLNPNDPPTTWQQVRADAKQIAAKTGQAGFSTMTEDNTGGWSLVTLAYAFGGRAEVTQGKKTVATVNTAPFVKALTMLYDMRWDDNSMGGNYLYNWNTINQAFAAGSVGMYVSGGGNYTSLVQQNAINPKIVGETVIPLSGKNSGALGGGTIAFVSTHTTPAQQAAAVKWISYFYMDQQYEKSASIAAAKLALASKNPVGVPEVPVFGRSTYEQTLQWTAGYVNVPLSQFKPYTTDEFKQQIIAEPPVQTQGLYADLDPVVQAVLTDQGANIPTLLSQANSTIQTLINTGN